jgi:hypothetical protein
MKKLTLTAAVLLSSLFSAHACDKCQSYSGSPDFKIASAKVVHNASTGTLDFEMTVDGTAGKTQPTPGGSLDKAPVLAYVFITTLKPEDIGFAAGDGIVALALTSHPDFDDSPLWDENTDGNYDNDGLTWHPHWVVLVKDTRVKGGFSVKEHAKAETVTKPKTAPAMPMYMDSPGFPVVTAGQKITVSVPAYRISNKTDFKFDALTCYLEVSAPAGEMNMNMPMLGVYNVFSILSKDLSIPYAVESKK